MSGNIDGGGGINKFDYSARFGAVFVNFQSRTASQMGGTFNHIGTFIGGAGSDSFTGAHSDTDWNLTGASAGDTFSFTFSSFENLSGGAANDPVLFYAGSRLGWSL